jgi:uncharacterized membrane protein YbhN (UPF0104 family)
VGVIALAADAWATHVCLAVAGLARDLRTIIVVRGATTLLAMLNYALGVGGLGFYLHRTGVRGARALGLVLFILVVNFGGIVAVATLGLTIGGAGLLGPWAVVLVGVGLLLEAAYLATVAWRPPFLVRREVLGPVFEAGIRGHAIAGVARLPHVGVLVLGAWGGFRIWGVDVPFFANLLITPALLLVAAVPISPQGFGTVQALHVALFSRYAPGDSAIAREACVLAFSLSWHTFSLAFQFAMGALCYWFLRRRIPAELPSRREAGERPSNIP